MLNCVFRSGEFEGEIKFSGFEISGHAGYGEAISDKEGRDIVCAAVSSCTMLVCNCITENFGENADVTVEENRITLTLTSKPSKAAVQLLSAFYEHLEMLSEDYKNIKLTII